MNPARVFSARTIKAEASLGVSDPEGTTSIGAQGRFADGGKP
jgi:hypothetical protein